MHKTTIIAPNIQVANFIALLFEDRTALNFMQDEAKRRGLDLKMDLNNADASVAFNGNDIRASNEVTIY